MMLILVDFLPDSWIKGMPYHPEFFVMFKAILFGYYIGNKTGQVFTGNKRMQESMQPCFDAVWFTVQQEPGILPETPAL